MADKWIQDAVQRPGAFTKKAEAADMGVQEYAKKVLKPGSEASTRTKRQAALARRFSSGDIARANRAKARGQRSAAKKLMGS
jgi:hypothetical protein